MSEAITLKGDDDRASQACAACKKRKGRCDRSIPCCYHCKRRNLPCYYPDKKVKLTSNQTNRFPPAFFLDYDLFSASSSKLPPASLEVPSYVSAEIGDYMKQHTIASQYFATIHLWMPIVSNPRCFNTLLNPLSFDRADVALLCLAMKLNLWLPTASSSDPHTTTYIAARQFLYGLEISGTLSLPILQAAILITIYEIGHAIYPAAYASISVCIQYAAALGLEWKTTSWRDGDQDWIESEERRRVWWAIVILERYISLGCRQRRIITTGPRQDELLPIDDAAWDKEVMVPRYSMTVSAPSNINMGRFARLSQATYLLDRVLQHLQDSATFSDALSEEAIQLDKALRALVAFTESETNRREMRICTQTALCQRFMLPYRDTHRFKLTLLITLSGLALLHVPWLYPANESIATKYRSALAWDAMDQLSDRFLNYSKKILSGTELPILESSPLSLHWSYQALVHFCRPSNKNTPSNRLQAQETIQEALKFAYSRWKLTETYLDMLTMNQYRNIQTK
ncbi:hypothetical protein M431DRAFT_536292, partial [Trichoderma harzianum CBS 226.95]